MADIIKCPTCKATFNPAYLDQVVQHMHEGIKIDQTIKGQRVMIKANELRFGNWIQTSNNLKFPIIVAIDFGSVQKNPDFYHPISLTPEILEKCGFEMIEEPTFDYHCKYFTQTDTKGCEQKSKFSLGRNGTEVFLNDRWICGITFLHQLQNLYFALTGEELTVKLLSRENN